MSEGLPKVVRRRDGRFRVELAPGSGAYLTWWASPPGSHRFLVKAEGNLGYVTDVCEDELEDHDYVASVGGDLQ